MFVMGTAAGTDHIVLVIKEVEWEERCSLFMAADCLLDSCIRDGLNLNPFEYFCCRSKEDHTAAILSEFTGCSRALASPIRVNPWNVRLCLCPHVGREI